MSYKERKQGQIEMALLAIVNKSSTDKRYDFAWDYLEWLRLQILAAQKSVIKNFNQEEFERFNRSKEFHSDRWDQEYIRHWEYIFDNIGREDYELAYLHKSDLVEMIKDGLLEEIKESKEFIRQKEPSRNREEIFARLLAEWCVRNNSLLEGLHKKITEKEMRTLMIQIEKNLRKMLKMVINLIENPDKDLTGEIQERLLPGETHYKGKKIKIDTKTFLLYLEKKLFGKHGVSWDNPQLNK